MKVIRLKQDKSSNKSYKIKSIARSAQRLLAEHISSTDKILIHRNIDNSIQIGLHGQDITGRVWLAMEGPAGSAQALAVSLGSVIEFLATNTRAQEFSLV